MSASLYHILVVIDFTGKNKWALAKAVELSNQFHCQIHLVYCRNPLRRSLRPEIIHSRLQALRETYRKQLCGSGGIEMAVVSGQSQQELMKYVQQQEIDLVIIGLSKFNLPHRLISSVSITRLAKKITVPVLGVSASGLVCHFKKIILPVTGEVPLRQIRLAALIGRAFRSTVYFVSLRVTPGEENSRLVDQALELLQSISSIPVQCIFLEGKNLARGTLQFARQINADLILANPLKDFRLPGFWNRVTNRFLQYASGIPVATVGGTSAGPESNVQ